MKRIIKYFLLLFSLFFVSNTAASSSPTSSENNDLSPYGECFDGFSSTFLRHLGTRHLDGPAFVAKVDMVTCSAHCRSNFDPASEESFPCEGFNFRAGRNPVCEFFPSTGASRNATKSLKIENSPTYYYEKVCLRVAKRCEEAAYMFDVKKGYRIEEIPKKIINVTSERECMEECVKIQCQSFGFHHDAKRCSFYNTTRRDSVIIRDPKMDYFENNCLHPTTRCPNGRIEFFVTRKADVPSFGISLGVKSIRSCMQACINAAQFFCRSIQFDSTSNECFISDETSDVAVPSSSLDIYEPFCVPNTEENTCNRPYTFEKMITSRLMKPKTIVEIPHQSTEKCLQKCIDVDNCKSVNYNVLTRICGLLSTSKTDSGNIVSDENFDFYELTCPQTVALPPRTSTAKTTTTTITQPNQDFNYKLVERSRELLEKFKAANYSDVENVQDCWKLCLKTPNCALISFSSILNQCTTSKIIGRIDLKNVTRLSDSFDIYSSLEFSTTTRVQTTTAVTMKYKDNDTSAEDFSNNIFDINDNFMESTLLPPSPSNKHPGVRAHALPNAETKKKSDLFKSTELLPIDPELVGLEDSTPVQLPISAGIAHIDPNYLEVVADCLPQGINITFDLFASTSGKKYTGAVYASERFDQCRVFIKNASIFSIFIPRPKHNSWCNAVEINNEMSTIIIMSNDRILPHDVTTKDDLLYQVSCQYNQNDETRINKGIVVGGPTPVMITKKSQLEEKVSLEITRGGKTVESVFVGESLVATVKSNISAESLRIVDCTAHRVGGSGPPASVNLIADGCALLPSIMSPMKLTEFGWQSSLSAFRIDGSEQIDVVCIISMCEKEKCPAMDCPPSKDRQPRSASDENSIRVDRRLLVKSDKPDSGTNKLFAPICIESSMYLPGITLFLMSLISIAISIFLAFRRNHRRDARVEELLSTPIPHEPKYIKTVPL